MNSLEHLASTLSGNPYTTARHSTKSGRPPLHFNNGPLPASGLAGDSSVPSSVPLSLAGAPTAHTVPTVTRQFRPDERSYEDRTGLESYSRDPYVFTHVLQHVITDTMKNQYKNAFNPHKKLHYKLDPIFNYLKFFLQIPNVKVLDWESSSHIAYFFNIHALYDLLEKYSREYNFLLEYKSTHSDVINQIQTHGSISNGGLDTKSFMFDIYSIPTSHLKYAIKEGNIQRNKATTSSTGGRRNKTRKYIISKRKRMTRLKH